MRSVVRWRARTIVQPHGALRASRPQLKRDPLGGTIGCSRSQRGKGAHGRGQTRGDVPSPEGRANLRTNLSRGARPYGGQEARWQDQARRDQGPGFAARPATVPSDRRGPLSLTRGAAVVFGFCWRDGYARVLIETF